MNLFPDFDDNLRLAFQREIELFFGSVVQEDRSVLDLLSANYTFVNERLAKHYGIANIYGPQFRRVTLPAALDVRRGLLGKGALMTVTSAAARTSPVTRGKWFLQTFLGVSAARSAAERAGSCKEKAADTTGNQKTPTMRQTLEAHRAQPGVRVVPPDLRADGAARSRTSTPWAAGGRSTRASPIDATGDAAGRHQGGRRLEPAESLIALQRPVRPRRHRKAADLRARPRRGVPGHADGALGGPQRRPNATTRSRRWCWAS